VNLRLGACVNWNRNIYMGARPGLLNNHGGAIIYGGALSIFIGVRMGIYCKWILS
jgi:hypothetical protein